MAFFHGDPFVKFLAAFGAFATEFLARPLGGIIFGIFYGNIMVLFTECLPKEIRYTGFALAYIFPC